MDSPQDRAECMQSKCGEQYSLLTNQQIKPKPQTLNTTGESANFFSSGQFKPQQHTTQLVSFMMHILAHCSRKGQTTCVN